MFQIVDQTIHKLNNIGKEMFSNYIPIQFHEPHHCYLRIAFHSASSTYRFQSSSTIKSIVTNDEPTAAMIPKINHVKKNNEDLTHFLFSNSEGKLTTRVTPEKIDKVFDQYIEVLKRMITGLEKRIKKFTDAFIYDNKPETNLVIFTNSRKHYINAIPESLTGHKVYPKKQNLIIKKR